MAQPVSLLSVSPSYSVCPPALRRPRERPLLSLLAPGTDSPSTLWAPGLQAEQTTAAGSVPPGAPVLQEAHDTFRSKLLPPL